MRAILLRAALLLAAMSLAVPASAGTLGAVVENDSVTPSDREYTSGVKLFYVSDEGRAAALGRALLRAGDGEATRFGVALGQSLFTPSDIDAPAPPPGERPYAGWLYSELSVLVSRRSGALDVLAASIGVVGPAALGEEAQDTIHGLINASRARGWSTQLRNEPALVLSYDRLWRATTSAHGFGLGVSPTAGLSVGNVLTEARAGALLRIGWNLGEGYGPARVRPATPTDGAVGGDAVWSVSLFGGGLGRAVAHNLFLDGSTFRDSLSVDRKPLTGEAEMGAAIRFRRIEVAARYVWRAREYETQGRMHEFGGLTLAARF
ncbi:MAG: lipid A deacylase LpxR family protein [Parvularculaceae bacterium]|nr:lipid A deacylase LpxR family protein [Parvularculaceae bacterium]